MTFFFYPRRTVNIKFKSFSLLSCMALQEIKVFQSRQTIIKVKHRQAGQYNKTVAMVKVVHLVVGVCGNMDLA